MVHDCSDVNAGGSGGRQHTVQQNDRPKIPAHPYFAIPVVLKRIMLRGAKTTGYFTLYPGAWRVEVVTTYIPISWGRIHCAGNTPASHVPERRRSIQTARSTPRGPRRPSFCVNSCGICSMLSLAFCARYIRMCDLESHVKILVPCTRLNVIGFPTNDNLPP